MIDRGERKGEKGQTEKGKKMNVIDRGEIKKKIGRRERSKLVIDKEVKRGGNREKEKRKKG